MAQTVAALRAPEHIRYLEDWASAAPHRPLSAERRLAASRYIDAIVAQPRSREAVAAAVLASGMRDGGLTRDDALAALRRDLWFTFRSAYDDTALPGTGATQYADHDGAFRHALRRL